jgi:hypothetical protein
MVKSGALTFTDISRKWNNVHPPVDCMKTVLGPGEALLGTVMVSVEVAVPDESETIGGLRLTGNSGNENEDADM